jgi:CBS domain-containing protein
MDNLKALQIASKNLITIEIDEKVETAYQVMRSKKIRHLLVCNKEKAIGVVSERDLMKALHIEIEDFYSVLVKRESFDPKLYVRDVMSWPIKSVDEETPLLDVIDIMLKSKVSSLMVTKSQAVVGILTTDDLLEILKQHVSNTHATFWGEAIVNNVYSTPVRTVMEILSNTGI